LDTLSVPKQTFATIHIYKKQQLYFIECEALPTE
jgi:hypothetical protein